MDKVTVHDNNKLQFWLTFLKCDLKITLPHFVIDSIHICFTQHLTQKQKLDTWKTSYMYMSEHEQFEYKLAWPTFISKTSFSTINFARRRIFRPQNPMLTVRDYNCHRMYVKHSFCYMTVCTVVTQYIFWVGNNACAVNIAFKSKKWWGLL